VNLLELLVALDGPGRLEVEGQRAADVYEVTVREVSVPRPIGSGDRGTRVEHSVKVPGVVLSCALRGLPNVNAIRALPEWPARKGTPLRFVPDSGGAAVELPEVFFVEATRDLLGLLALGAAGACPRTTPSEAT